MATYVKDLVAGHYQIHHSENGKLGVEFALEHIPDVIVSDVMMPIMDGFEATGILKQDERTSHIPIVLLTAKTAVESRLSGIKAGADVYLNKPFNQEELFLRLEKLRELRNTLRNKYADFDIKAVPEIHEPTLEEIFLQKLTTEVESLMSDPDFAISTLESKMKLSKMQLYRKLKALTGNSPTLFIRNVRLNKAMHLLKTTDLNVSEVAYDLGFSDPSYFSRVFKERYQTSPSEVSNS